MAKREIIIKETHRGLRYEDGVMTGILGAGRHVIPRYFNLGFWRTSKVEIKLVDVRQRDLTIKGQEILTSDKVAIRVSIIVQFKVTDPQAALHVVEQFEDRLYSDVQLAARRSLATMSLEEILTNRNKLSEDILSEVKESATTYGVEIIRADVKDLIFPGNLQEIMNRVLAAERMSEARIVEAKTDAETQRLAAEAKTKADQLQSEMSQKMQVASARSRAEIKKIESDARAQEILASAETASAFEQHPALLKLKELDAIASLGRNASARIYFGVDKKEVDED